jgi:hypothetical protein
VPTAGALATLAESIVAQHRPEEALELICQSEALYTSSPSMRCAQASIRGLALAYLGKSGAGDAGTEAVACAMESGDPREIARAHFHAARIARLDRRAADARDSARLALECYRGIQHLAGQRKVSAFLTTRDDT